LSANRDTIEQVLRDHQALRCLDTDPELEAVRAAILVTGAGGTVTGVPRSVTPACQSAFCTLKDDTASRPFWQRKRFVPR
jgi:hypothetical protein